MRPRGQTPWMLALEPSVDEHETVRGFNEATGADPVDAPAPVAGLAPTVEPLQ